MKNFHRLEARNGSKKDNNDSVHLKNEQKWLDKIKQKVEHIDLKNYIFLKSSRNSTYLIFE